MNTILFGFGLAVILIFSMALTVFVIGVIIWTAYKSPRTGGKNRRYPSTDANGAIISTAAMYDTTNPSPSPDSGTPHHGHDTGSSGHHHGHSHHDAGSFGGHSHSGGFDGGGGGHSHGGSFDGGGGGHGH